MGTSEFGRVGQPTFKKKKRETFFPKERRGQGANNLKGGEDARAPAWFGERKGGQARAPTPGPGGGGKNHTPKKLLEDAGSC